MTKSPSGSPRARTPWSRPRVSVLETSEAQLGRTLNRIDGVFENGTRS